MRLSPKLRQPELVLGRQQLPVADAARGPAGHHKVAVLEEDGVVRVLELLRGEELGDLDHRDDVVVVVEQVEPHWSVAHDRYPASDPIGGGGVRLPGGPGVADYLINRQR